MKVLVVDDFATMRKIIKNVLKQIDIENVVEAESGKPSFSRIKDLVVRAADLVSFIMQCYRKIMHRASAYCDKMNLHVPFFFKITFYYYGIICFRSRIFIISRSGIRLLWIIYERYYRPI